MTKYDGLDFLGSLGHLKPRLRVLELGAGSGAATVMISECLQRHKGQDLLSRYVPADASTGLDDVTKVQFKSFMNQELSCINIVRDLVDQGFDYEIFDLMITAGVMYTMTDLARSQSNTWQILSPKGKLLV